MFRRNAESPHRHPAIAIFLAVLTLAAAAVSPALSPRQAHANTPFPETGYSMWGPFEQYFYAHGGLAQFGMARTSPSPPAPATTASGSSALSSRTTPPSPIPIKSSSTCRHDGRGQAHGRSTIPPDHRWPKRAVLPRNKPQPL